MQSNYFLEEEICNKSIIYFVAWNKVNHFRKSIHYTKIESIPLDVLGSLK